MGGGKQYRPKALAAMRLTSVIATGALVVFALTEEHSPHFSLPAAFTVLGAFLALDVLLYVVRPSSRRSLSIFLLLYYAVAVSSTVIITGSTVGNFIFWLTILMATDAILGFRILLYGIMFFLATMFLYGAFLPGFDSGTITDIFSSTILTATTAGLIGWLRSLDVVHYSVFERAKMRERIERERLETIINSLKDAVISVDEKGTIKIHNAATLDLIDTNVDIDGRPIDDVIHLFDEDGEPLSLREMITHITRQQERDDLSAKMADGAEIRIYLLIAPLRNIYGAAQNQNGAVLILRDITRAKTLEDERDEFISVVSHELRTPVTIAEGTLSNLQYLLSKGNDPKALTGALNDAHEQVIYLAGMVNDLSTLSRAERGVGMEREPIDVREFMETLYHKYLDPAKKKGLQLDLDLSPHIGKIYASRMYLEEIMQNIVENAIKYTPSGSVCLMASSEKGKYIKFAVRDTGIGISKSDQNHVFAKFWRSEDYRTRETNGTGLGLHVVERLAHMMGTKIELSSRLNHGSTFSLDLPIWDGKTVDNDDKK